MKLVSRIIFVLAVATVSPCFGVTVEVPLATESDEEVSVTANKVLPHFSPMIMRIVLKIDNANLSNNAELALGHGEPDNSLGFNGTQAVIAYDNGAWTITGNKLRDTYSTPAGTGTQQLVLRVKFDRGTREPESLLSPLSFDGLETEDLLELVNPSYWSKFKVTSRGGALVSASVEFSSDPSIIMFR